MVTSYCSYGFVIFCRLFFLFFTNSVFTHKKFVLCNRINLTDYEVQQKAFSCFLFAVLGQNDFYGRFFFQKKLLLYFNIIELHWSKIRFMQIIILINWNSCLIALFKYSEQHDANIFLIYSVTVLSIVYLFKLLGCQEVTHR